ncbi:hypothetical protein FA95DRAFT_1575726 [Auriscalpium vulgare]|uniref:Uncharacterized protein n=1 Tax=Auriscalpium vulgare TaxID=40419 RepID=A0ACB8REE2_9AGAM|nr:hypothetical protein FA95DRAFT_1575726 [Auriscalpium vulgare]
MTLALAPDHSPGINETITLNESGEPVAIIVGFTAYLVYHEQHYYMITDSWPDHSAKCTHSDVLCKATQKGVSGIPRLIHDLKKEFIPVIRGVPDHQRIQEFWRPFWRKKWGGITASGLHTFVTDPDIPPQEAEGGVKAEGGGAADDDEVVNSRRHTQLLWKPHARPMHMFQSRYELVKCWHDIVADEFAMLATDFLLTYCTLIHKELWEAGILVRSISLTIGFEANPTIKYSQQVDKMCGIFIFLGGAMDVPRAENYKPAELKRQITPVFALIETMHAILYRECTPMQLSFKHNLEGVIWIIIWICSMYTGRIKPIVLKSSRQHGDMPQEQGDLEQLIGCWRIDDGSKIACDKASYGCSLDSHLTAYTDLFTPYFQLLKGMVKELSQVVFGQEGKLYFST